MIVLAKFSSEMGTLHRFKQLYTILLFDEFTNYELEKWCFTKLSTLPAGNDPELKLSVINFHETF